MNKKVSIKYGKLFDTIKTLKTLEDVVNNVDFSIHFDDMEKYFREINFEHANCLNYKEFLETIYEDLDYVRRRIMELGSTLSESSLSFLDKEELSSQKIERLLRIYQNTNFANSLRTEINQSNVSTIPEAPYPEQQQDTINTVPIGVAIGATGVIGSVGAVVVNEMFDSSAKKTRRKKEHFEEYHVSGDDYHYQNTPISEYSSYEIQNPFQNESYSAVRKDREADRYYGENIGDNRENKYDSPRLKEIDTSKTTELLLNDNDEKDDQLDDLY